MSRISSRITLALVAAAAIAAPALAQAPAADSNNFNGPYIGGQLGWQQDRQSLTDNSTTPATTLRAKGDGLLYGGQIGYDFNLGKAVIGLETSLTGRTGTNRFPTFDLDVGRTVAVTARAGFLVSPDALLYARGGYSNARFSIPNGPRENRDGYTIGAGYEQKLTQNVSARIEYNYSDYGNDQLLGSGSPSTLNYHRHAVTTGLNFRF